MSQKGKGIGISEAVYLSVVGIFRKNRDGLHLKKVVELVSAQLEEKFTIGRQTVIKAIRRLQYSAMVEWLKDFIRPTTEFFSEETTEFVERFLTSRCVRRHRYVKAVA